MEVLEHKPDAIHGFDEVRLPKDTSYIEIQDEKEDEKPPQYLLKSLQVSFPQYDFLHRKETYTEILKNYGTNIRYKVEFIGQEYLWKPDLSQCSKVVMMGENLLPKYPKLNSKEITDKIEDRLRDIIWFSYRKNFPVLLADPNNEKPNEKNINASDQGKFVSDTGWGCMIRACQMTYAECLRRLQGKENIEQRDIDIISWFLDSEMSPTSAPYSIQTISRYLKDLFLVKPGTWLKPSTVLLSLGKIQEEYGKEAYEKLQIEVFIEGTLFINQALRKATGIKDDFGLEKNEDKDGKKTEPKNSLLESDNLVAPANAHERHEMAKLLSYEWKGALMISILAKLGLDKPNIEYLPFLKEVLAYPESAGVIAGKPGFAYFVVGHVDDYLIYLDPHFVQDAVNSKDLIGKNRETYTCSQARYINYHDIDTSVAINFLIRDRQHFQEFIERFRKSCKHPDSFLGVEVAAPRDDVSDFESVEDDDDFVRCGDDDEDSCEY